MRRPSQVRAVYQLGSVPKGLQKDVASAADLTFGTIEKHLSWNPQYEGTSCIALLSLTCIQVRLGILPPLVVTLELNKVAEVKGFTFVQDGIELIKLA